MSQLEVQTTKPSKLKLGVNWVKLKSTNESNDLKIVDLLLQRVAEKGVHPEIASRLMGQSYGKETVLIYLGPIPVQAEDNIKRFREVFLEVAGEALATHELKKEKGEMTEALLKTALSSSDPLSKRAFEILRNHSKETLMNGLPAFFELPKEKKNLETLKLALTFVGENATAFSNITRQRIRDAILPELPSMKPELADTAFDVLAKLDRSAAFAYFFSNELKSSNPNPETAIKRLRSIRDGTERSSRYTDNDMAELLILKIRNHLLDKAPFTDERVQKQLISLINSLGNKLQMLPLIDMTQYPVVSKTAKKLFDNKWYGPGVVRD